MYMKEGGFEGHTNAPAEAFSESAEPLTEESRISPEQEKLHVQAYNFIRSLPFESPQSPLFEEFDAHFTDLSGAINTLTRSQPERKEHLDRVVAAFVETYKHLRNMGKYDDVSIDSKSLGLLTKYYLELYDALIGIDRTTENIDWS